MMCLESETPEICLVRLCKVLQSDTELQYFVIIFKSGIIALNLAKMLEEMGLRVLIITAEQAENETIFIRPWTCLCLYWGKKSLYILSEVPL